MEGLTHRNVSVFKKERINVDGTYWVLPNARLQCLRRMDSQLTIRAGQ